MSMKFSMGQSQSQMLLPWLTGASDIFCTLFWLEASASPRMPFKQLSALPYPGFKQENKLLNTVTQWLVCGGENVPVAVKVDIPLALQQIYQKQEISLIHEVKRGGRELWNIHVMQCVVHDVSMFVMCMCKTNIVAGYPIQILNLKFGLHTLTNR